MRPILTMQDVRVVTGSADEQGKLIAVDGALVAVLVRLDDPIHGSQMGSWHPEALFGPCATALPPLFPTVEAAQQWVLSRISRPAPTGCRHPPG